MPAPKLERIGHHITSVFPSTGEYVAFLQSLGNNPLGEVRQSLSPDTEFYGKASLQEFLLQCQMLSRDDFTERHAQIDAVANQIAGDLPQGVSLRRQRIRSRSGSSVNIHTVLRGDLSHAWTKAVRQQSLSHGNSRMVLVVSPDFLGDITHEQITWSAIATLALADYARRSGRQLEMWSLVWHKNVVLASPEAKDFISLVRLSHAGDAWNSSTLCLTTYPEWLRRLDFRLTESLQEHWEISGGYGGIASREYMLDWLKKDWAPTQHLEPESIYLGCVQGDSVSSHDTALAWLQRHLEELGHAAS